tara:strand:- start:1368 stop:1676 length:309 start_codon:yes stop_codon:yes gene_type:complete
MESGSIIAIVVVAAFVGLFFYEENRKKKGKRKAGGSSTGGVVRKSQENGGKPSKSELKKLTKNQLIDLAEKKNLKVKKSGSKAAVITQISDQLDDDDEFADL